MSNFFGGSSCTWIIILNMGSNDSICGGCGCGCGCR